MSQSREQRMAERRARLAKIKERRAQRNAVAAQKEAENPSPNTALPANNIDALVSSLLREPAPAVQEAIGRTKQADVQSHESEDGRIEQNTASVSKFRAEAKMKSLKMSFQVGEVNFSTQAKVTYAKASQTMVEFSEHVIATKSRSSSISSRRGEVSMDGLDADTPTHNTGNSQSDVVKDQDDQEDVRILSQAEVQQVISSSDFSQFLNRAARVSERALFLNNKFDVMVEYGKQTTDSSVEAEKTGLNTDLYFDKLCGNRTLTKIAWSPQYSELILGCYNANTALGHASNLSGEPDGNVLIWSLNKPGSPEMRFTCQSPILTAEFHPNSPSLVVGGAYSGQIILWDMRASHTPVQRTISTDGHSLPVYSLQILGGQNIVSISTDGKLRLWDVNQLATPKVARNLCWSSKTEPENTVAVTAATLTHNENMITVGGESGHVHKVQILGANPGVQQSYQGHFGMVTDMHQHPVSDRASLNHLTLSSGIDWSVKLWNLNKSTNNLLHSFSSSTNYIFSARWSPIHPALFASCDASGTIEFWDLSTNMEVPAHRIISDASSRACSSLRWARDGRKIATGSLDCHIRVYDVKPALADPEADTVTKFENALQRMVEQINERVAAPK